jgi:hypothetical protein
MVAQRYPNRADQQPTRQQLPPRPQSKPKQRNTTPYFIAGVAVIAGFFMTMMLVGLLGFAYMAQARVADGVTVANIDLGGATRNEATSLIQQAFNQPTVTLVDGERTWTIPLAQLGATVDTEATLKAALDSQSNRAVQPQYVIDLSRAQQAFVEMADDINIDAVPGRPPIIGRSMEIPVMLDRLRVNATGELSDGVFELNMFDVEPPALDEIDNYRDIYQGPETVHIVERGQELALIAREYGVDMDEIVALNNIDNPSLIFVGQELLIPAAGEYQPSAEDAPPAPLAQGKSIVVSVDRQRIYAYENGELIHSHLTSTGLPATPTVKGDFNIYVKHVRTNMSGPDYFLPDVPYTMYFYKGYGIHGTYWHNSFGRPMSHGCVNLPTPEAEWFFNWAEVGTLVRVI